VIRAVALVALAATAASADDKPAAVEPDPDAIEAGDANLEPVKGERRGITVSVGLGGALTLGFGIEDATGRGGAGTIRIGRVATRRTLITLELSSSALFHGASMSKTAQNNLSSLAIGAQYYARSRLWIRLATGYAVYQGHDVLVAGGGGIRQDVTLHGVASTLGIGVEVAKWRRVALQLETFTTSMINRDGLLTSSGLLFGASFD
jgi:hypothetical protein